MFIVKRFFCFKTKPSIPPHQSAITPSSYQGKRLRECTER